MNWAEELNWKKNQKFAVANALNPISKNKLWHQLRDDFPLPLLAEI